MAAYDNRLIRRRGWCRPRIHSGRTFHRIRGNVGTRHGIRLIENDSLYIQKDDQLAEATSRVVARRLHRCCLSRRRCFFRRSRGRSGGTCRRLRR